MNGSIDIRFCRPDDFDAVYRLINLLEDAVFPTETQRDLYLSNLSHPDVLYLLAIDDAQPVGFLSCHIQLLLHHAGPVGEIQELIVLPDYRRRGVGKALLDRIKTETNTRGVVQLEVASNQKREAAHRFYEREGFASTHFKFVFKPRDFSTATSS